MISELFFVRNFGYFWNELLPGGEYFVRLLNSGLVERFDTPLNLKDSPKRRAILNLISFYLSLHILEKDAVFSNPIPNNLIERLYRKAKSNLGTKFINDKFDYYPKDDEINIITILANRIFHRFKGSDGLRLSLKFKGCGIINSCEGDLYYKDTLVEIKSGERNFSILDFRQMLVYSALNYISDNMVEIKFFHLYNPRTGLDYREDLNVICNYIAKTSPEDLYNEIINFISNQIISL